MGSRKSFELPRGVGFAVSALEAAGFEAYAVGGAVRDLVRGVEPSDFDITTRALPAQVKEVFRGFKTYDTGIKHGTVTVISDGMPLEITTYRIEDGYSDGRHPDGVRFAKGIEDDLSRRDFTVNAMAFSPSRGLVDPFGGEVDIKNRVIRAVGEAEKRFEEDGLRIMRALRFAAVLGFEIEAKTAEALFLHRQNLLRVSSERLSAELGKLLCGEGATAVLKRFAEVFATVYPSMLGVEPCSVDKVENCLEQRLAALFFDLGEKKAGELCQRLRFSHELLYGALCLAKEAGAELKNGKPFLKREMRRFGADSFIKCLEFRKRVVSEAQAGEALSSVREILQNGECYDLKGLALDGDVLISAGVVRGRAVGEALELLLDAVIGGKVENSKECLLKYFLNRMTDNKGDGV
ncbi:MAG: CCA tRNA nucleotidyltransferase [Clostridia bacterium]|nr:CCA tRNA nucleotidyltransferase [Clostridia bacterium]